MEENTDEISGNYLVSRQVSEEYNSPAATNFRTLSAQNKEPVPGDPEFKKQGEAEEPWIDPVSAGTAGFGGTGASLLMKGMKLMPSLGRALVSGVVGGAADIPIGMATEGVGEKAPALAVPFNILTGILSGATVESVIERKVIGALGKKATPEAIKEMIGSVKGVLAGEAGAVGDDAKRIADDAAKALGGEISVSKAKEIQLGSGVPKTNKDLKKIAEKFTDIDDFGGPEVYSVPAVRASDGTIVEVDYRKGGHIEAIDKLSLEQQRGEITDGFITSEGRFVERPKHPDGGDMDVSEVIGRAVKSDDKDKYAININMDRIEKTEDIESMIRKTAQAFSGEIDEARRGKITNKETEKIANLVGMTPEQLLKRKKGLAFNAEEAVAARRVLVSSADNLSKLAQKVQSLEATDIDKFEFRKALNMHYAIQAQVSGMTAEAGRALQSFNIQAKSTQVKVNQIKDMLARMPGGASTEKMAEAISTFDSPEQIGAFVKQAQKATTIDMFLEAWINGLLSGPQTHAVNILSNSLNAVWQIPERLLASQIGRVTGKQAITEREVLAQAYGLIEGFSDGLKSFAKVVKTGESSDIMGKIEQAKYRSITAENIRELPLIKKLSPNALQEGGTAARAVDLLGEGVRLPGRFLLAEDEIFKSVGYRMELRARAVRTANEEGLTGTAAAQRINNILSDPQTFAPDVHLAAVDAARYQTFTQPLESGILNAISQSRNPVVKILAPFVRTPTNILKFGFERSPLAPLMKGVRADIEAGGARRDLALARMSLGSMLMATVGVMTAKGHITGGGPSNSEEFSTWRRSNQPYSIKVGDTFYSYNRLEPAGMAFGLAADFVQIAGLAGEELQPEVEELAGSIVAAISKNVTSKTWLRGISEAVKAMDDPDRHAKKYIENFVGSMVPAIVAQTERTINPELEAVYSMMDALKARIPGLSKDLPRRRDLWGNAITTATSDERGWAETVFSSVSPVYIAKDKGSPIDDELLKNKIHIRNIQQTQTFEGVNIELTPQQHEEFIILTNKLPLYSTGMTLKASLNNMVINDPVYKNASSDQKEFMIRARFLEAKEIAKAKWLEANPLYRELLDYQHQQAAMGQR